MIVIYNLLIVFFYIFKEKYKNLFISHYVNNFKCKIFENLLVIFIGINIKKIFLIFNSYF